MKYSFFEKLKRHISENYFLYTLTLMFILIGVVIGIYVVKYMGSTYKNDLANYLKSFVNETGSLSVNKQLLFFEGLKNNIIIIGLIYLMGISIVGMPIILVIDLAKGFMIGFTSGIIINSLGSKGVLFTFLTLIPQNLIYIPCIIFASSFSMILALSKVKNKFSKSISSDLEKGTLLNSLILCLIFIIAGALVEGYLCPQFIKLIY